MRNQNVSINEVKRERKKKKCDVEDDYEEGKLNIKAS